MPPITVVIADGDKTSRALSMNTLQPEKGISVVGLARNGLEAIMAADGLKPRILLVHVNMFERKKVNLLWALCQESPRSKVILVTRRVSEKTILEGLSNGARGYLKETAINSSLPKAVRQVEAGEAWVPRKMVAKIIDRLAHLTGREKDSDIGLKYNVPKSN